MPDKQTEMGDAMHKLRVVTATLAMFVLATTFSGCDQYAPAAPSNPSPIATATQALPTAVDTSLPEMVDTGVVPTFLPPSEPTIRALQAAASTATATRPSPTLIPPTPAITDTPLARPSPTNTPTNTPTPTLLGEQIKLAKHTASLMTYDPPRLCDKNDFVPKINGSSGWPDEPGSVEIAQPDAGIESVTLTTIATADSSGGGYMVTLASEWTMVGGGEGGKHRWFFHVDNNHYAASTGEDGDIVPYCPF